FSCSSEGDKRKAVRDSYGEPDLIEESEFAGMKIELYVYARKDINRAYEFRKTVSSCGGSGQWYVYRMYFADYLGYALYLPPEIKHTPVESAPPGDKIIISAEVADDEEVVSVTLYYRVAGDEEFLSVRMTASENNIFSATIPAEVVIVEGVEYYIEANDEEHSSELPKKGVYVVAVSSKEKVVVYKPAETSAGIILPSSLHEPGEIFNDTSPVSP
ncbi:unnamed protein product, partial [marine sediment metagenome]